MKRIALLVAPVVLISVVACNNGKAYIDSGSANTANSQPANLSLPPQTNGVADTTHPVNGVLPVAPITAGGAGLNPEHGKPGHRCDLAVGAPLNSQPTTAATTPITTQPVTTPVTTNTNPITVTPTAPASQPVAAGMNPEHGKPGHRCDIAVGQPLNSKPAAVTTTPAATQAAPTKTTVPNPVAIQPQAAAPQKVAAGMNPAHGQPGHRCDIAVGEPLNGKPAATTPQVSPLKPQTTLPLAPLKPDTGKN